VVKVTLETTRNQGKLLTDVDVNYEFCTLDNGDYSITMDLSTLPLIINSQSRIKVQMMQ